MSETTKGSLDHGLTYSSLASIPGWLLPEDFAAFQFILKMQVREEPSGDLAEFGVYKGKSAALIGAFRCVDERFTVVDLFANGACTDSANQTEHSTQYADLSLREFEKNYLSKHADLPVIVQGPSTSIVEVASHRTHRFVHIDASHLYEHVVGDINAAQLLLRADGVVVLDDYRSAHTPGVAAAAWAAVADGLRPFLLTGNKMYATWGDSTRWEQAVSGWVQAARLAHDIQDIAGCRVHRVWTSRPAAARWVPPVAVPFARALYERLRSNT